MGYKVVYIARTCFSDVGPVGDFGPASERKLPVTGKVGNGVIEFTKSKPRRIHKENMSVKCIPPYTPLLYSKTGIFRGVPIFLSFAPKHRLWVHVSPQSMF